jgi:hypothetical protein
MLLVWARAFLFAQLNDMDLIVSRWEQLKVGPILRNEKHHRLYFRYFRNPSSVNWLKKCFILAAYQKIKEPEIARLRPGALSGRRLIHVFERISRTSDYFEGIKEHRDDIRGALLSMLAPSHREELLRLRPPVIGVHVRHGDFRKLAPGEEFGKYGHIRAPLTYFKTLIQGIRQISGRDLPVTLFSDGSQDELRELLNMPGVRLSNSKSDIVDLLLLSMSKIIITSPSSTFSYWSAFLSDAAVFHHPDHASIQMRATQINQLLFEGSVAGDSDEWPPLLRENIRAVLPSDNRTERGVKIIGNSSAEFSVTS